MGPDLWPFAIYGISFIPHHRILMGCFGFTLVVHDFVHPTVYMSIIYCLYFPFLENNLCKHGWIFIKFCACTNTGDSMALAIDCLRAIFFIRVILCRLYLSYYEEIIDEFHRLQEWMMEYGLTRNF